MIYDDLTLAMKEGKPLPMRALRIAAPGDLLDWNERIAARLVREYAGGRPPRYLMRSRDRIRSEAQRRMAGGS